jgi:hypothetical protein
VDAEGLEELDEADLLSTSPSGSEISEPDRKRMRRDEGYDEEGDPAAEQRDADADADADLDDMADSILASLS